MPHGDDCIKIASTASTVSANETNNHSYCSIIGILPANEAPTHRSRKTFASGPASGTFTSAAYRKPELIEDNPNMAEQSAKSFLGLLERSGIVAEERLKSALSELAAIQSKLGDDKKVSADTLTSFLVEAGLITDWHVEKIKKGKYKGFFLGKFKLLGHLGTGGMSSVYLAEHRISEKKRAIKVLPKKRVSDKSYLDRFYLEGRAAAALNHPNVVRIYDICNEADTHFMVMEYANGRDLYETVKEKGPLSFDDAAGHIIEAAKGLAHAHEKGLVHRDIKPANLLLTRDGEVKILDLGLALFQEDEEESLTVLYNEKVMGTADYLSPEQAINSHEVDHRADIYSLGCTLYYLLTGKPPFSEGTLAQRIAKHQTAQPPSLKKTRPDCPDELIAICSKMMAKSPDQRFANCNELEQSLQRLAAHCVETVAAGSVASTIGSSRHQADVRTTLAGGSKTKIPLERSIEPSSSRKRTEAGSRTEEIKSGETIPNDGDDPASSPFAIEYSSVPDNPRSSVSSKIMTRAKPPATTGVAPKIRVRRKKKLPIWIVPTVIGGMLILLIGVLMLVASQL